MADLGLIEEKDVIRMRRGCRGKEKSFLAVTDTKLAEGSMSTCKVVVLMILYGTILFIRDMTVVVLVWRSPTVGPIDVFV